MRNESSDGPCWDSPQSPPCDAMLWRSDSILRLDLLRIGRNEVQFHRPRAFAIRLSSSKVCMRAFVPIEFSQKIHDDQAKIRLLSEQTILGISRLWIPKIARPSDATMSGLPELCLTKSESEDAPRDRQKSSDRVQERQILTDDNASAKLRSCQIPDEKYEDVKSGCQKVVKNERAVLRVQVSRL